MSQTRISDTYYNENFGVATLQWVISANIYLFSNSSFTIRRYITYAIENTSLNNPRINKHFTFEVVVFWDHAASIFTLKMEADWSSEKLVSRITRGCHNPGENNKQHESSSPWQRQISQIFYWLLSSVRNWRVLPSIHLGRAMKRECLMQYWRVCTRDVSSSILIGWRMEVTGD
jgi:hypothetical protein